MTSLLAKIRQFNDKELALVIDVKNSLEEVQFLSELDELLNKYGKEVKVVRVVEF